MTLNYSEIFDSTLQLMDISYSIGAILWPSLWGFALIRLILRTI